MHDELIKNAEKLINDILKLKEKFLFKKALLISALKNFNKIMEELDKFID